MSAAERILSIGPRPRMAPRLSVLTPFYKHDPSPLLEALRGAPDGVEFVLVDDGSASATLLADVAAAAEKLAAPTRIVVFEQNQGRAAARNRLVAEARGEYVLFLDADMIPDAPNFLAVWLGFISWQRPFVAFGGLSLRQIDATQETALHHGLFARSDCKPAHIRERNPAQSVATANLLVRRDFLAAHPFDSNFVGWGFEDVDWALSAARHAPIAHIDNPATHAGLDSVDTLLRKCAEAGPNFARLAAKHPRQVARFAAHRAARALKRAPQWLRGVFAWLARDPMGAAPMPLRCAAVKLYRASHYAEHLP